MQYLCKRFVLKLLFMLKEGVQAVLLHNDLRLIREDDGVSIKRYPQLCVTQLVLHIRAEHGGCSNAYIKNTRKQGDCCFLE